MCKKKNLGVHLLSNKIIQMLQQQQQKNHYISNYSWIPYNVHIQVEMI